MLQNYGKISVFFFNCYQVPRSTVPLLQQSETILFPIETGDVSTCQTTIIKHLSMAAQVALRCRICTQKYLMALVGGFQGSFSSFKNHNCHSW